MIVKHQITSDPDPIPPKKPGKQVCSTYDTMKNSTTGLPQA